MRHTGKSLRWAVGSALIAAIAACGGEAGSSRDTTQPNAPGTPPGGASSTGSASTPDPGGKVIPIEMLTDEQGNNVFRPADFEAKRGDVIRYTLVSGVHNAHFVADSNPGKPGLPPAGPLLQLPGQTYDVKVSWDPGKYYYQCDPHALLGMKGYVTVTN